MFKLKIILILFGMLTGSIVHADYTNFCVNMPLSSNDAKNISKVVPTKKLAAKIFPLPDSADKISSFYFVERISPANYHITLEHFKGKEKADIFNADDYVKIKEFAEGFKSKNINMSSLGYQGRAAELLFFVYYKGIDGRKTCLTLTENNLNQMDALSEIYYANLVVRTNHDDNLGSDWGSYALNSKKDPYFGKYASKRYSFVPHITIANIFKFSNRAYHIVSEGKNSVIKNKKHPHVRAKTTAFAPAEFKYLKTFFYNVNAHFQDKAKPNITLSHLKVTTKIDKNVKILRNIDLLQ
jgi:2'-5' RNA ligase